MMSDKMSSYRLPQHITATPRKLLNTNYSLTIIFPYIRRQEVRSCLHLGQTSINMTAEENWVIPC